MLADTTRRGSWALTSFIFNDMPTPIRSLVLGNGTASNTGWNLDFDVFNPSEDATIQANYVAQIMADLAAKKVRRLLVCLSLDIDWRSTGCWIQRHSQRLLDSRSLPQLFTGNYCVEFLRQHHRREPWSVNHLLLHEAAIELEEWHAPVPDHRRECYYEQRCAIGCGAWKLRTAQQRRLRVLSRRVSLLRSFERTRTDVRAT